MKNGTFWWKMSHSCFLVLWPSRNANVSVTKMIRDPESKSARSMCGLPKLSYSSINAVAKTSYEDERDEMDLKDVAAIFDEGFWPMADDYEWNFVCTVDGDAFVKGDLDDDELSCCNRVWCFALNDLDN